MVVHGVYTQHTRAPPVSTHRTQPHLNIMNDNLGHLHSVAHYQVFSPILLKHAVTWHRQTAEAGVNPPRFNSHCSGCGVMKIPGLNVSVRVGYYRQQKSLKKRSRVLVTTCFSCGHSEKQKCLLNTKQRPQEITQKPKSKKRKNKNDLSAMLEQKKAHAEPVSLFGF